MCFYNKETFSSDSTTTTTTTTSEDSPLGLIGQNSVTYAFVNQSSVWRMSFQVLVKHMSRERRVEFLNNKSILPKRRHRESDEYFQTCP